jgi:putative endonuclease
VVVKISGEASKRNIGKDGERFAVSFLEEQGYTILEQNYTFSHGEIDIVAKDQDELVFVEVKMRRNPQFGSPEESVTPAKQELLRRTAEGYVQEKKLEECSCRFDVVAIKDENGVKTFVHYKNAF